MVNKKYRYIFLFFLLALFSCTQVQEKEPGENKDVSKQSEARSEIIDAQEINQKIAEGETILYKNATIVGDVDFCVSQDKDMVNPQLLKHYINESVTFYNCTFKGKVIAQHQTPRQINVCRFRKHLTFMHCTFQDSVNFHMSDFDEVVNFSHSEFQSLSKFSAGTFMYRQNFFRRTKFIKIANFDLINVYGNIDFFESEFFDDAIFQLSEFSKTANFNSTIFHGNTDFSNIKFADDAFFNYSEFTKKSIWINLVFRGRAEFNYAIFKTLTNFTKCIFYRQPEFSESNIKGIFTFKDNTLLSGKVSPNDFPAQKGTDFIFD